MSNGKIDDFISKLNNQVDLAKNENDWKKIFLKQMKTFLSIQDLLPRYNFYFNA